MIPKIIHYCWLSDDKYPDKIQKCIDSWKIHLPDYQFKLWDLKAINLDENIWVKQAFESKKYAFAADYIRLFAVYNHGGIYFDTDIEVLKPFDDLLHLPYFLGSEGENIIEAGVFGAEKNAEWLADCLEYYKGKTFINDDGSFNTTTLPIIMGDQIRSKRSIETKSKFEIMNLISNGDVKGKLFLFPKEYFCAKNMGTGILENTSETYSIHHFAMSWIPYKKKWLANVKRKLMSVFGVKTISFLIDVFNLRKLKSIFFKK